MCRVVAPKVAWPRWPGLGGLGWMAWTRCPGPGDLGQGACARVGTNVRTDEGNTRYGHTDIGIDIWTDKYPLQACIL